MVFRATALMRDSYTLKRARVDAAKLKPDEVREAAAVEALKKFRAEKEV
jgi:hypothetical protein